MSNTIINARIIDQKIQIANTPLIASGSQDVLQISCAFDSLWEGYGITAVFYRDKKTVYHVPVYLSTATVPHEVLAEAGHFYFGFFGVAENTRTTEVLRLEVKEGAITIGTEVPDPTPDVYAQLMQMIQQSGIIPDSTLTQAGQPADAKAVGEAIDAVIQDTATMMGETIDDLKAGPITLVRGVHYGTEAEIPADLPEGGLFFKVVG